jgi:predicted PolB exonuclease-like 3'-5' exonuclease
MLQNGSNWRERERGGGDFMELHLWNIITLLRIMGVQDSVVRVMTERYSIRQA